MIILKRLLGYFYIVLDMLTHLEIIPYKLNLKGIHQSHTQSLIKVIHSALFILNEV